MISGKFAPLAIMDNEDAGLDSMLLLKRTALVALSKRFLMTQIRLGLMLYSFMVAHKAACQTLSKAFMKSMKTWIEVLLVLEIFLTQDS